MPSEPPGRPLTEEVWIEPCGEAPRLARRGAGAGGALRAARVVELAFVAAIQHLPAQPARRADPARGARLLRRRRSARRSRPRSPVGQQRPAAGPPRARRAGRRAQPAGHPARARRRAPCASSSSATWRRWRAQRRDAVVVDADRGGAWSMPPLGQLVRRAPATVEVFLRNGPLNGEWRWRHLPARANGQLAVGTYTYVESEAAFLAVLARRPHPRGRRRSRRSTPSSSVPRGPARHDGYLAALISPRIPSGPDRVHALRPAGSVCDPPISSRPPAPSRLHDHHTPIRTQPLARPLRALRGDADDRPRRDDRERRPAHDPGQTSASRSRTWPGSSTPT